MASCNMFGSGKTAIINAKNDKDKFTEQRRLFGFPER